MFFNPLYYFSRTQEKWVKGGTIVERFRTRYRVSSMTAIILGF